MRENRVLYGIAALALLAILAVFIAYATDNLPTHTPRQHVLLKTETSAETPAPAVKVKKKSCKCCAGKRNRLQKKIQAARERRKAAQRATTVETSAND